MNALRIAWIAVRELIHERVFYVLLSFGIISLGTSLLLGQLTYAEQYKLTLDLMLAGAHVSMVLFSVFIGISLLQKELAMGSVTMVLSKPISRTTFLLGKFLGQSVVQLLVTGAMCAITLIICSSYQRPDFIPIIQTSILLFLEVTILTAITYFFAVNSGAVTTAVGALFFFCVGHFQSDLTQGVAKDPTLLAVWRFCKQVLPNLEVFNLKSEASYGIALSAPEMGWLFLYAAICIFFYLLVASLTFGRRDILT